MLTLQGKHKNSWASMKLVLIFKNLYSRPCKHRSKVSHLLQFVDRFFGFFSEGREQMPACLHLLCLPSMPMVCMPLLVVRYHQRRADGRRFKLALKGLAPMRAMMSHWLASRPGLDMSASARMILFQSQSDEVDQNGLSKFPEGWLCARISMFSYPPTR